MRSRTLLIACGWALATLAAIGPAGARAATRRIVSLDQCADQYVLALAPAGEIAGLSRRARNADSYIPAFGGAPLRRATLESTLAANPTLVVRYWGGDPALVSALRARGIAVAQIEDATDFVGLRTNLRRVGAALGQQGRADRLIGAMDRRLAGASGAWRGAGGLYLSSGGASAGPGVLMDSVLVAAGLRNLNRRPGYGTYSMERLVLEPPSVFALGFFDEAGGGEDWASARKGAVEWASRGRPAVRLPARELTCPAWFVAEASARLAAAAHKS